MNGVYLGVRIILTPACGGTFLISCISNVFAKRCNRSANVPLASSYSVERHTQWVGTDRSEGMVKL